jgi:hypothetical protein
MRSDLPPLTSSGHNSLISPRMIELCLQTAGVWEIGQTGALALPNSIERICVHRPSCTTKGSSNGHAVYAAIRLTAAAQGNSDEMRSGGGIAFDARVVDGDGNVCLELEGYRTARLPDPISDELIGPLRTVVQGSTL